jgi:hypothetical protein
MATVSIIAQPQHWRRILRTQSAQADQKPTPAAPNDLTVATTSSLQRPIKHEDLGAVT